MKQINWKDHLVNLVVVILGISIAFYLEGWQSGNQQKQLERQFLQALDGSLTNDAALLDTLTSLNKDVEQILIEFVGSSTADQPDSIIYKLYRIFYSNPFVPQTATYESMKTSGALQSLNDFDLQNRIVSLYENYYDGTKQWDELSEKFLRDFYRPFVIGEIIWENGAPRTDFLDRGKFKRIVYPMLNMHQGKAAFYELTRTEIDSIKLLVKAYTGTTANPQ